MARTTFTGINPTRGIIAQALQDADGDLHATLPAVAAWVRGGLAARGWAFIVDVAMDLDAGMSPTLRSIAMRALEMTEDPADALRLVQRLVDRRDNPELAARIWREAKLLLCGAVWRALVAEDRARRRGAGPQLAFDWGCNSTTP